MKNQTNLKNPKNQTNLKNPNMSPLRNPHQFQIGLKNIKDSKILPKNTQKNQKKQRKLQLKDYPLQTTLLNTKGPTNPPNKPI